VGGPVVAGGGGDEARAGGEPLLPAPQHEAAAALEDVVDLVLVLVGVWLLRLAGAHAVEVELGPHRRGQRHLGHAVEGELRVLLDVDPHGPSSSARASSVTVWTTSTEIPRARHPRAIGTRHPRLPRATTGAPDRRRRPASPRPSSPAPSGWSRLYTPALPQQSSASPSSTTVRPGMRRNSSRGSARTRWPCWRWQASWYATVVRSSRNGRSASATTSETSRPLAATARASSSASSQWAYSF